MGSSQSVEETLDDLLRQQGIRIARRTLRSFVKEVDRVAPWYAVSGSLTLSCWRKLGTDLDAEIEKGTLRNGTKAIWRMVQNCLEDEACSIVV